MKLLVISDIHAFATLRDGGLKPSFVQVGAPSSSAVKFREIAAVSGFPQLDFLMCPGDLGDRADPSCIEYAWQFLNEVKGANSACLLLATAGNHDIDSRHQHSPFDAKAVLYKLAPTYPCSTSKKCLWHSDDFDRQLWFWARNFYLYSTPECRFVVLNSAAYHGAGVDHKEYEHGRISEFTLACIRDALTKDGERRLESSIPQPKLNVLLCHHHLMHDGLIEDKDYSDMQGAHGLINFLSDAQFGRWLVLHGHRHRARLYQTGGAAGPYVLSAGSFGATRDKDYSNTSPNQVHFVDLDFAAMDAHHFYPAGRIRSWTWVEGAGWIDKGSPGGGLPPQTAFGFRGSLDKEAFDMAHLVAAAGIGIEWQRVVDDSPARAFLDYAQLDDIKKQLASQHGIELKRDEDRNPAFLIPIS